MSGEKIVLVFFELIFRSIVSIIAGLVNVGMMMKVLTVLFVLGLFIARCAFGVETAEVSDKENGSSEPIEDAEGSGKNSEKQETGTLTIEDCIELAIKQNREFLREEEGFILEHISYELTRHNYGPLLTGALSSKVDDAGSTTQSVEASLTQRLFTGGDLSISATSTGSSIRDSDIEGDSYSSDTERDSYSTVLSLSYVQPLLKDAGRLVAREELTSAERELTYAWRSLILFRQEFLIGIVRQYYRILQQKSTIKNQEKKVENAELLLERSKAQMGRGKATPIDVYRAELTLLQSENQLIDAKDFYELSLDEFKIDLGLPTEEEIVLQERELQYAPAENDVSKYLELALSNRLDLRTANDRIEDSKRNLDIARNRLRSRLDLGFTLQSAAGPAERFKDQDFGDAEWLVELEYEVPFDRMSERTDYRKQLIAYLRQVRDREKLRDRVIVEVRSVLRDLRRTEAILKSQERNIVVAEKQLERARNDYDRGTITNRYVVDALDDLTDARNKYDEAIVDYTVAKLDLLRIVGTLEFERWRDIVK